MELSAIQKQIVTTDANQVVVVAAAAAGKTRVLTERVRYLLNDKKVDPSKIVVITFTNAAAEELATRLGHPQGLFIGTIHSYANGLLLAAGVDTSKYLSEEKFDELFRLVKKNPQCIKSVKHLLLDEAQDSTPEQFQFLLDMVLPDNYMLVGDYRQSIYRFAGATPDYLLELIEDPAVTTYDLNENYRNGSRILDYGRRLINMAGYEYIDYSIAMAPYDGQVIETPYSARAIAESIKRRVESGKATYGSWFVLCRTNAQVDDVCWALKNEKIPYDTFKRAQLDQNEFNKKMEEDTVKVLTIHTSKGLEADNVIVVGARFFNVEEKCINYVAATRAKKLLVWTQNAKRNPGRNVIRTTNWD
jgi:superfamily I DNA/RNA helicase